MLSTRKRIWEPDRGPEKPKSAGAGHGGAQGPGGFEFRTRKTGALLTNIIAEAKGEGALVDEALGRHMVMGGTAPGLIAAALKSPEARGPAAMLFGPDRPQGRWRCVGPGHRMDDKNPEVRHKILFALANMGSRARLPSGPSPRSWKTRIESAGRCCLRIGTHRWSRPAAACRSSGGDSIDGRPCCESSRLGGGHVRMTRKWPANRAPC